LAGAEGFSARLAKAHKADDGDDEKARLDEEFAAIGPVDAGIFQVRIGEEAVPEERSGGEINREVQRLPKVATEPNAHVGSEGYKRQQVKSDGADRVVEGLGGRMEGVDKVEEAKVRRFVEEQNQRMND